MHLIQRLWVDAPYFNLKHLVAGSGVNLNGNAISEMRRLVLTSHARSFRILLGFGATINRRLRQSVKFVPKKAPFQSLKSRRETSLLGAWLTLGLLIVALYPIAARSDRTEQEIWILPHVRYEVSDPLALPQGFARNHSELHKSSQTLCGIQEKGILEKDNDGAIIQFCYDLTHPFRKEHWFLHKNASILTSRPDGRRAFLELTSRPVWDLESPARLDEVERIWNAKKEAAIGSVRELLLTREAITVITQRKSVRLSLNDILHIISCKTRDWGLLSRQDTGSSAANHAATPSYGNGSIHIFMTDQVEDALNWAISDKGTSKVPDDRSPCLDPGADDGRRTVLTQEHAKQYDPGEYFKIEAANNQAVISAVQLDKNAVGFFVNVLGQALENVQKIEIGCGVDQNGPKQHAVASMNGDNLLVREQYAYIDVSQFDNIDKSKRKLIDLFVRELAAGKLVQPARSVLPQAREAPDLLRNEADVLGFRLPMADGWIRLSWPIFFTRGSAELDPAAKETVCRIANWISFQRIDQLHLVGFEDRDHAPTKYVEQRIKSVQDEITGLFAGFHVEGWTMPGFRSSPDLASTHVKARTNQAAQPTERDGVDATEYQDRRVDVWARLRPPSAAER